MGMALEEVERMNTPELYNMVLQFSMDIMTGRISCMKLGEKHIEVPSWPLKNEFHLPHDILNEYDPAYNETI